MSSVRLRAEAVEKAANQAVDRLADNLADVGRIGPRLHRLFALVIAAQGSDGDGWVNLDVDDLTLVASYFVLPKPEP